MNLLKPRKTTFNPKLAVYRRFTRIEKSLSLKILFKCPKQNSNFDYFAFDYDNQHFVKVNDNVPSNVQLVTITSSSQIFQSGTNYFYWDTVHYKWQKTTTLPVGYTSLANAGFSNIGRYQTNTYYFVGSIDYIITGEVAGTKTQPIKGNIMPLTSMNIKYYDDYLNLDEEDLVVVDGHLYSVESPDYSIKHSPRPYKIYYATLNSIL